VKEGFGKDTFANGDTYEGDYKRGKPDGIGIYTWANGSQYEGPFVNGVKHGSGCWRKTKFDDV